MPLYSTLQTGDGLKGNSGCRRFCAIRTTPSAALNNTENIQINDKADLTLLASSSTSSHSEMMLLVRTLVTQPKEVLSMLMNKMGWNGTVTPPHRSRARLCGRVCSSHLLKNVCGWSSDSRVNECAETCAAVWIRCSRKHCKTYTDINTDFFGVGDEGVGGG